MHLLKVQNTSDNHGQCWCCCNENPIKTSDFINILKSSLSVEMCYETVVGKLLFAMIIGNWYKMKLVPNHFLRIFLGFTYILSDNQVSKTMVESINRRVEGTNTFTENWTLWKRKDGSRFYCRSFRKVSIQIKYIHVFPSWWPLWWQQFSTFYEQRFLIFDEPILSIAHFHDTITNTPINTRIAQFVLSDPVLPVT